MVSYARALQLLLLALLIGLWELVVKLQLFTPLLFPSLFDIGNALIHSVASGELWFHVWRTLTEIFLASFFAMLVGIPVGILLGSFRFARSVFEPLLLVAFCIPLAALIPLFIVWFGIGMKSKVVFAAIYGFFPICLLTMSAVGSVNRTLVVLGQSLGGRRLTALWKIVLPAGLPDIVAGVQQGVTLAIIGAIASEMYAAIFGIGYLIQYSFTLFEIPRVYAMAFVTLIIAYVLNVSLRRVLDVFLARAHHYHPSIHT
jgi:NitT/TauT family transport system permease protein